MTDFQNRIVTKQPELFTLAAELPRDAKRLLRMQPTIEYKPRIKSQYEATCQLEDLRNQLCREAMRLAPFLGGSNTLETIDKLNQIHLFVGIITVNLQNWL